MERTKNKKAMSLRKAFVALAAIAFALCLSAVVGQARAYADDGQEMYRLYNPNSGEHFYTADPSERDYLDGVGWNYEGSAWIAPKSSNTEVHRLYSGTDHHYTMDAAERDWLIEKGWSYEGVGWYSDDAKGKVLYRVFNPNVDPTASKNNSGSHHYTLSASERDWLVSQGWQDEGTAWFGLDVNAAPTTDKKTDEQTGIQADGGIFDREKSEDVQSIELVVTEASDEEAAKVKKERSAKIGANYDVQGVYEVDLLQHKTDGTTREITEGVGQMKLTFPIDAEDDTLAKVIQLHERGGGQDVQVITYRDIPVKNKQVEVTLDDKLSTFIVTTEIHKYRIVLSDFNAPSEPVAKSEGETFSIAGPKVTLTIDGHAPTAQDNVGSISLHLVNKSNRGSNDDRSLGDPTNIERDEIIANGGVISPFTLTTDPLAREYFEGAEGYQNAAIRVSWTIDAHEVVSEDDTIAMKYTDTWQINVGEKATSYTITKAPTKHGSFEVQVNGVAATSAAAQSVVTVVPHPDENYEVDQVQYSVGGDPVDVQPVEGVYSFEMDNSAVTVSVTFRQVGPYAITQTPAENGKYRVVVFDEPNNDWKDITQADYYETVTIEALPYTDGGYVVDSVTVVTTAGSKPIQVDNDGIGNYYTFNMPSEAVTVTVTFKQLV